MPCPVAQRNGLLTRSMSKINPKSLSDAAQTEDKELAEHFAPLAKSLAENEDAIVAELTEVQGDSVDIGGYYYPDAEKITAVMRPSKTFNEALEAARA